MEGRGGHRIKNIRHTHKKKPKTKKEGGNRRKWEYYKTYETNYQHYAVHDTHNTTNYSTTYTQSQAYKTPPYTTKQ